VLNITSRYRINRDPGDKLWIMYDGMLGRDSGVQVMTCGSNVISLGLARTIYTRFIHGILDMEITKYTVVYGADILFWPTLVISHVL